MEYFDRKLTFFSNFFLLPPPPPLSFFLFEKIIVNMKKIYRKFCVYFFPLPSHFLPFFFCKKRKIRSLFFFEKFLNFDDGRKNFKRNNLHKIKEKKAWNSKIGITSNNKYSFLHNSLFQEKTTTTLLLVTLFPRYIRCFESQQKKR